MSETVGLDHLTLTVVDLARAQAFYDAALQPLGIERLVDYLDPEDEDEAGVEAVGYGLPDGRVLLWLVVGAEPTAGLHLAFRAADRESVRAFFTAATGAGAAAHRSPRPWQIYRPGGFTAMVGDGAGNLLEARAADDQAGPPTGSRSTSR